MANHLKMAAVSTILTLRQRGWSFRRMECEPGEQAWIDFGTGALLIRLDGKRRRTQNSRVALSYSRKAYSDVVYLTPDFRLSKIRG
jgi:hypothetical protein